MIKTVIFDLDNTLCNTEEAILLGLEEAFEKNMTLFPNQTVKTMLDANYEAFKRIYSKPNIISTAKPIHVWFEIYKIIRKKPNLEEIIRLITSQKELTLKNLKLYEGAEKLFEILKQKNIKIGILTNGAYVEQGRKLIKLKIASFVDSLITPDISLVNKPHQDSYRYILSDLKVKAGESIMIGNDIVDDLQGAKLVGMRTLLLTKKVYGTNNNDSIVEYSADNFHEAMMCITALLENN